MSHSVDVFSHVLMKESQMKQDYHHLSLQQQGIIPIASFAAIGDMPALHQALKQGLDKQLSINEIKEILVQVYAYAGFPRSLNALNEFMLVLQERKEAHIQDQEGKVNTPLPSDYQALKQGSQTQEKLVGHPVIGPLFDFAPDIDEYLKSHLFGDIFARDILNWQDREIATVAMLAAMSGTEGQLKAHVQIAKHNGVTIDQLQTIQTILRQRVSVEAAQKLAHLLHE